MIQIKHLQISHGVVVAEQTSDPLDVDYLETVKSVQQNARREYWDVLDTPDGVIKTNRSGFIEIFTVILVIAAPPSES